MDIRICLLWRTKGRLEYFKLFHVGACNQIGAKLVEQDCSDQYSACNLSVICTLISYHVTDECLMF
jgi:hypothetical protein